MLDRGYIIIKDNKYLVSLCGEILQWNNYKPIINPLLFADAAIAIYIAKTLDAKAVWAQRSTEYFI